METPALFAGMDVAPRSSYQPPDASAAPRVVRADRSQASMEPIHLDDLLPDDHPARVVWEATGVLNLSAFYDAVRSRGAQAGRPATDPRVLVALWIYAATEGVASGRELEQLCYVHAAFKWLRGGLPVNYHTLNDFRCGHAQALDALMTDVLGRLTHGGLLSVTRITQDGTKVRACAGTGSFKRRETLEEHLKKAADHVQTLRRQADGEELGADPAALSNQRQAARRRAAEDRLSRITQAMEELAKVEAARAVHKDPKTREKPARASITEPEARKMRMPDNGYRTAHNVQFAQDAQSRAIVGVEVGNQGSDANVALWSALAYNLMHFGAALVAM
jgi:transposase